MRKGQLLAVIAVVAVAVSVAYFSLLPREAGVQKIIIAVQPTQNPLELREVSNELASFLSERIGLPVEVYFPTDYPSVIEALRFRTAHVALVGSWPAYLAVSKADAELLLVEVRTVAVSDRLVNATYYYSYWIVPKDSPYNSLGELRGKRVCFPSPLSSSGYLAPIGRLVELGLLERRNGASVDPEEFFGKGNVYFGGGYGQCWEALKAGKVDVTVMAGDVSYALYAEAMGSSKILEMQGPLPSHGVVVVKDLPPKLKEGLRRAFLELSDPQYRGLMKRLVSALFVGFEYKSSEEHFAALEKYIKLTGFNLT